MKNLKAVFCLMALLSMFRVFAQPTISSFSPQSGPAGSSVTITGSNFSSTPANNVVYFGAVKASVTAASATSLTVAVPIGASYQPVSVTVNGLIGYASKPFLLTFPGGSDLRNNPDQSQYSFGNRKDFTTDLHPNGIVASDFDGDGKVDLATANNYSTTGSPASISILRNTGTASIDFAPRIDIQTGVMTFAIAAGDLDGDGKQELISSSIVDKTISVFKNISTSGNIVFAPKFDLPSGTNPYSIAIAEFNGDGKPDIVVANYLSNTISIYRNTSTGGTLSFAPKTDLLTALAPRSVATGDFDNDGRTDIAVSNELSNSLSLFRNISVGSTIDFAAKVDLATGTKPYGVAVGDINLDGLPDLVVANNNDNKFSVIRNTSSGTGVISFAAKTDYSCGANPYNAFICDANGDGKPDIGISSMNITVHQNNSAGSNIVISGQAYLFAGSTPFMIVPGDFDGDGKPDLAGGIFTSDKVMVLRNRNNEPAVRMIYPNPAAAGVTVSITGGNFTGTSAVLLGGVPVTSFSVVDASTISAVVGSGASGNITVTNQYGTGELTGFVFAGPPVITSFTPAGTGTGNTVTINGNNLNGATAVSFGGTPAASYVVVSPTRIEAVVGTGATGSISVTTPYGTTAASGFSFLLTPTLAGFSPATAATGQTVTITGTNFSNATAVSFGGVPAASFSILSNTQITAVVGNGASGDVRVTNVHGSASRAGFTYIPQPQISSFTPQTGGTGTTVTISGSNFTGATAVDFGGLPANSFTINSANSMTAIVGAGASGNLSVTTPGGTASSAGFNFLPPPSISSFTPALAFPGTTVTINGSGFGSTIASNKVMMGSLEVPVIDASPTLLKIRVPEIAANKKITVRTSSLQASSEQHFQTAYATVQPEFTASSFAARFNVKGGIMPPNITNADVDGDGKTDIITSDLTEKLVLVLRNTSTTTLSFAPRVAVTPTWYATSVVAGDLDGDGRPDLVVGTGSHANSVSVLRNLSSPGAISFAQKMDLTTPFTGSLSVALGDIDRDGRLDIVARGTVDSFTVYLNNSLPGQIRFANAVSYKVGSGLSTTWVFIEDMDGDKKPEIVTSGHGVFLYKNNSTPGLVSFSATPFIVGGNSSPAYVSVADMDGDGKKDILYSASTGTITVQKNESSTGSFQFSVFPIHTSVGGVHDIKAGDLNGDGKPELVYIQGSSGGGGQYSEYLNRFSIFRNTGAPGTISFAPKVDYPYTHYYHYSNIDMADFNGDNSLDLMISFDFADSTFIFQNGMGRSQPVVRCQGTSASFIANATATAYQWQLNTGSGFVDLANDAVYTGVNGPVLQIANTIAAMNGNLYRCRIDDRYSLIFPLNVYANMPPTISISYTGCASSSLTFSATTANSGDNPQIDWYVSNTLSGTGHTFKLTAPANGAQVYAKLTASQPCATPQTVNSPVTTVNCLATAVPSVGSLETFSVSPNPTTGVLVVQLKLQRLKKLSFRVTDASGNAVFESKPVNAVGNTTKRIDLRGKAQGVYYLEVTIGEQRFTQQIVLVR